MSTRRSVLRLAVEEFFFDRQGFLGSCADIALLRTLTHDTCCYFVERTILLDLAPDESSLYGALSSRARHSIAATARQARIVRAETPEQRGLFLANYLSFARSRRLPLPPADGEEIEIFLALSHHGELLHACAFLACPAESIYRYRYSVAVQKSQANAAVVWEGMREARARGFKWFDLGGVLPQGRAGSRLSGIDSFKRQFGGTERDVYVALRANRPLLKVFLGTAGMLLRNRFTRGLVWGAMSRIAR